MGPKKPTKSCYSSAEARALSGVTQRQLDYWDQIGLVEASVRRKTGTGKKREYSYTDLIKLKVVAELRKADLSLQKIRKALKIAASWDQRRGSWIRKKFITDGKDVFVTTPDRQVLKSILNQGQLAFSVVFVGEILEEAHNLVRLYDQQKAAAG